MVSDSIEPEYLEIKHWPQEKTHSYLLSDHSYIDRKMELSEYLEKLTIMYTDDAGKRKIDLSVKGNNVITETNIDIDSYQFASATTVANLSISHPMVSEQLISEIGRNSGAILYMKHGVKAKL